MNRLHVLFRARGRTWSKTFDERDESARAAAAVAYGVQHQAEIVAVDL